MGAASMGTPPRSCHLKRRFVGNGLSSCVCHGAFTPLEDTWTSFINFPRSNVSQALQRPNDRFNAEDANTSANPEFEHVLQTRLNRRHLLRGSVGLAGMGLM